MIGDPTKYPEWYKRFLRGVAQVESSGGVNMMNPTSTATGLYGQLYSEVKDLPMLKGVSREAFAADTAMQNRIMEQRFEGNIPGVPGLMKNVIDITARYKPQLGDKFTFRPDEIAALTNFIGRQGTMNYLASIRDGKPFTVPGDNKTPEEYLEEYNLGFGAEEEEQPQERKVSEELQNAFDILQRDNRFGGRVKKKKYYNGGMLTKKDPTLVPDPPEDSLPANDILARLSLGITPPDQQFRLTGGDAPFRTIKEQKDVIAEQESEGDIMEVLRYLPVTGEVIDATELAKVAATGKDIYGQEQDPGLFAAMTAAGYVIPNVLEKPLKSAWRAVKKFPAKMPKKEFRELMGPEKDQVRANLTQGHLEVYGDKGYTESLSGARPVNVRQLPSLMSGSKLENAVGKDGMIQVSQIENLINSKDISEAERTALQDALNRYKLQHGFKEEAKSVRETLGGLINLEGVDLSMASQVAAQQFKGAPPVAKINYNEFRALAQDRSNSFRVDRTNEMANYGVDRLGYSQSSRDWIADNDKFRTNLIRTTDPDLQSTEYGHFGEDVIGHYRTFERPDEEGVLYISELQADPLQARGPAGQKTVGLSFPKQLSEDDVARELQVAKKQIEFAELAKKQIAEGKSPQASIREVLKEMPDRDAFTDITSERMIDTSPSYGVLYDYDSSRFPTKDISVPIQMDGLIRKNNKYIQALEGGYRGGPNPKQANLIKNQDQFLISHILEQEAKGADKLRFPTGETTSKIQGYGDIEAQVTRSRRDLETEQGALDAMMEELDTVTGEVVPSRLANRVDAMGLSGMDADKAVDYLGRVRASRSMGIDSGPGVELIEKFDNDALKQAYKEIKEQLPPGQKLKDVTVSGGTLEEAAQTRAIQIKKDIHSWNEQLERIKTRREHLDRVNASTQATEGIMKGYDRLPKALKKHGLDATKVTDDAGNTWWEVDIPARLGEGVGEIRAYNKGGQVSDKIRVLKKEGYPQKQAVAIALAMKQEGRL